MSSPTPGTPTASSAPAGSNPYLKIIKAILLGCNSIAAAILVGAGKLDPNDPNFQEQADQALNILQTQEQRVLYAFDAQAEALSGTDPNTSFGDPQLQLIAQALTGQAPVPGQAQLAGIQPLALLQLLKNAPPAALASLPASTQAAVSALLALVPAPTTPAAGAPTAAPNATQTASTAAGS